MSIEGFLESLKRQLRDLHAKRDAATSSGDK